MLTLEDVNSVIQRTAGEGVFHVIDTADVGTFEFDDVKLDFCIVSHEIADSGHQFTFEIENTNWHGAYYFLDKDDNYLDIDLYNGDTKHIVIRGVSEESVKLVLYCTNIDLNFNLKQIEAVPVDLQNFVVNKSELGTKKWFNLKRLSDGRLGGDFVKIQEGLNVFDTPSLNYIGFMVYLKKTNVSLQPEDELLIGKVNQLPLGVHWAFLPGGVLVGDESLDLEVKYNNSILPVYFDKDLNDYVVDLDLRDKTTKSRINLEVIVNETSTVNRDIFEFKLDTDYVRVDNFGELVNEITVYGTEILQITESFDCLSRINVGHDLVIYGNGNKLNLNGYGFNILEGVTFKLNNLECRGADTLLNQGINTKIDLTDCTFCECTSDYYNNLGSVVYCDVNLESLSEPHDFITNIMGCTFINNHNCLFHGGELTIENCKYWNNDSSFTDNNNPAFLYQTDGVATISDSIFDITYDDNNLCSNLINLGFAQALIQCGETAAINNATIEYLQEDNRLPFFEAPYNNSSHVFAKYYYPALKACLFTSPVEGNEDKNICYCVTGSDKLFKTNTKITRAGTGAENNYNKINMGD